MTQKQDKDAERRSKAFEKAFLDVDEVAESLIRLISRDLRYTAEAKTALQKIMKIKQDLLEVVQ